MDAKELRIGNLVFKQGSKLVKQSPEERNQVYMIENVNLQSAKNFSPIPLTEERLLKFGFSKHNLYKESFVNGSNFCVHFDKQGNRFFIQNDSESDALCYKILEVKFVHELQNFFFLAGIELEYKKVTAS